jgi:hypothetical protein
MARPHPTLRQITPILAETIFNPTKLWQQQSLTNVYYRPKAVIQSNFFTYTFSILRLHFIQTEKNACTCVQA